mmetsp:Transcript_10650/g.20092  ORF Transcript_10650/g.20092 Transcript_10650/m.20092 type:complete len:233 (-) Transcript_10650:214-912(-)
MQHRASGHSAVLSCAKNSPEAAVCPPKLSAMVLAYCAGASDAGPTYTPSGMPDRSDSSGAKAPSTRTTRDVPAASQVYAATSGATPGPALCRAQPSRALRSVKRQSSTREFGGVAVCSSCCAWALASDRAPEAGTGGVAKASATHWSLALATLMSATCSRGSELERGRAHRVQEAAAAATARVRPRTACHEERSRRAAGARDSSARCGRGKSEPGDAHCTALTCRMRGAAAS